jgi:hypothetical protein
MIERHVLDDRVMAAPLLTALAAWDGTVLAAGNCTRVTSAGS